MSDYHFCFTSITFLLGPLHKGRTVFLLEGEGKQEGGGGRGGIVWSFNWKGI